MTTYLIRDAALALATLLTSFSANAENKATLADFVDAPGADRVMLIDERPEEEKTKSPGSLNIGNCNYGVYRVADDMSEPARMRLLRSDLAAALGAQLDGRPVVVKHYGIYVNNAATLRRGVAGAAQGAGTAAAASVGAAPPGEIGVPGIGVYCPPDSMNGGWYGHLEVTTEFSPVIAELTVEVDGREYAVRTVISSPKRNVRIRANDATFVALLFEAMRGVTAELVTRLQSPQ